MATNDKATVPVVAKFLEVKQRGTSLVFAFGNGTKVEFDPTKCSDDINRQAMYHGYNQKIRDSAAGFSKDRDYAGAAREMQEVIGSLYGGSWNRSGGGTSGVVMQDLAEAIAKVRGVDVAKALAAVEKATPEQRATWAKNVKVAALMAEARAKRLAEAAKGASDDDLAAIEIE